MIHNHTTDVTMVTLSEGEPTTIVCTAMASLEIDIWWYNRPYDYGYLRIPNPTPTSAPSQNETQNERIENNYFVRSSLQYIPNKIYMYNGGEIKCEVARDGRTEGVFATAALDIQCMYPSSLFFPETSRVKSNEPLNYT